MTPVAITKNVEIGNDQWKPNATMVEETVGTIQGGELPQTFISADGNLYYWRPAELLNSYPQTALVESTQQNGASANGQDTQIYPQHLNGPELVNQAIQSDNDPKDLPLSELKRLIQLQFEYYFSRENLSNDSYLVSQMDSDQYVFISTVAKFNQIRKLTSDMKLIVEALKESPYVQLDESEQKVRANMKRCIVILREIPESTPMDEVKALFSHPNCPKWVSFEFAHNDSWYVTFGCEEDAKMAYRYLREEVQHFRGRPLMARIKAKTLLSRTVYLPKSANPSSSATVTCTTPSGHTTQFTSVRQPITTLTMPPNAVFHHPQSFPFYTTGPVNANPAIPGTWMAPRHTLFIQQDIHTQNNATKQKGNIQFISHRGRVWNRNYKNPKIPSHERNGILDSDERPVIYPRKNHHVSNGNTFSTYKKEDGRFSKVGSGAKKDYRSNVEDGPRFQRFRERRHKEEVVKPLDSKFDNALNHADMLLDLAMENFPALPSPNSPNENDIKTAYSLKELASSALQRVHQRSASEEIPLSHKTNVSAPSYDEQSIDASLAEVLTHTSITPTATSSNILSNIPKISYAQMAQKPNKLTHGKDNFDSDKVFSDSPSPEMIVSTNDHLNKSKSDSVKNISCPSKSPHKNSKGSPNPPRTKPTKDIKKSNKPDSCMNNTNIVECSLNNDKSQSSKDTYASKFGKVVGNSKPVVTSSVSVAKVDSSNTTTAWVNSQVKPSKTLPSAKPLMSQLIKSPTEALSEKEKQLSSTQFSQSSQLQHSNTSSNRSDFKDRSEDIEKKSSESAEMNTEKSDE